MSLKALGKLFIGTGLALLVYGLAMDTSVASGYGRVVNIGLANDRLMFILIGGFIFVGGVILYAVFKAKQTKEDEISEQEEADARNAERKAQALETSKAMAEKVAKDNVIWRLAHGLGVALLVTTFSDLIRPPVLVLGLACLAALVIVMRAVEYRKAVSQAWLLGAISMIYLNVHTIAIGKIFGTIILLPAALICYVVSKRLAKN